jgi:hypothetical protein
MMIISMLAASIILFQSDQSQRSRHFRGDSWNCPQEIKRPG